MCASRALSRACPPLDVADATGPPAPGPKPPLPRPPAAPSPASAPSAARRLPLAGATPPSARGRASHGRGVAVAPSVGAQSVATACRPTRELRAGGRRPSSTGLRLARGSAGGGDTLRTDGRGDRDATPVTGTPASRRRRRAGERQTPRRTRRRRRRWGRRRSWEWRLRPRCGRASGVGDVEWWACPGEGPRRAHHVTEPASHARGVEAIGHTRRGQGSPHANLTMPLVEASSASLAIQAIYGDAT